MERSLYRRISSASIACAVVSTAFAVVPLTIYFAPPAVCTQASLPDQRFDAACDAIKKKNFKTAHQHLHKLDKANHGKGQTVLGLLYEKGIGVEKDFQKAALCYTKGAEQGIPQAESNLGHLLLRMGDAIETDSKDAIYWLEKAADHGVVEAQLTLGKLLYEGKQIPANHSRAVYYLHNAAAQGNEEAQNMLDNIPQLRQAHQTMLAGGSQYQTGVGNLTKSWVGYADIVNNLNAASVYERK